MTVCRSLAAIALFVLPAMGGDVNGQVVITRRLTKKTIAAPVYNLRGTVPAAAPVTPVDEFARTVVILEGGSARSRPPETATIEQKNSRFEPDLIVIPVGSTVEFPNSDPIFHNVFSLSHAQSFDLGYYPKSQSRSVKFPREGIVQVYCHIHANMYAAIVVTASPWYGRPSETGAFHWSNVPAGHYSALAWHKVAGWFKVPVDVPQSGTVEVRIQLPLDVESVR